MDWHTLSTAVLTIGAVVCVLLAIWRGIGPSSSDWRPMVLVVAAALGMVVGALRLQDKLTNAEAVGLLGTIVGAIAGSLAGRSGDPSKR